MAVHVAALVAVILAYVAVLLVAIWAWRAMLVSLTPGSEDFILAGRNLGVVLGAASMTATWAGGMYVMTTTELIFNSSLVWAQAPLGYALSLILGGLFFAKKMREEGYVTMLDPFERKYGKCMTGLLYIPALLAELFTTVAALSAVGWMLAALIEADDVLMVIVTAGVAVVYTMLGGMYAVVYTGVLQLFCLFISLMLTVCFSMQHPAVISFSSMPERWLGNLATQDVGVWIDYLLVLSLGGIPCQTYFQRVLSSRSANGAVVMSFLAAGGCVLVAVPSGLLGVIATSTNWNRTDWPGPIPIPLEDTRLMLPMVMQYLCPAWVGWVGLATLSAAVMSSADSAVLGAASMFARNIYKVIFRQKASDREILCVMRLAILGVGILAVVTGITMNTIYGLWYLCADLVYVILFPQLVSVLYLKGTNTYGSLTGYTVGMLFRFLGGEPLIGLPDALKYPMYDYENDFQRFPFRTLTMLMSFCGIVVSSYLFKRLFKSGVLPTRWDVFKCVVNIPDERSPPQLPEEPPKYWEYPTDAQTNAGSLEKESPI